VDGVLLDDLLLDAVDEHGPEVAGRSPAVAAGADEVGITPAGPASGVGDDQAAAAFAVAAVDGAFEVVVVDARPVAGLVVGGEDVLDALPDLRADERLVAA
jgi:hypothetical protein